MAKDELTLAELLCARLCHDLASPIGAVGTGAELLVEEAAGGILDAEALSLLAASAAAAGQRLRFLRAALGSGGSSVGSRPLRDMASNFLAGLAPAGEVLQLNWQDGSDAPWESAGAKLMLNLVLLARDCLPRSGTIFVRARLPGQPWARVTAEGPRAAAAEAAAGLTAPVDGLGPRGAQGLYTALVAARQGLAVQCQSSTDCVVFTVESIKAG